MSDKNDNPRKGFPGSLFLLFLGSMFILFVLQGLLEVKSGNVSFSYQLEHLVNLDLIKPEQSRKTALNEKLVTFSGEFREKVTDEGKKRYKFLSLLQQRTDLLTQQEELEEDLLRFKGKMQGAAQWYLTVSGKGSELREKNASYTIVNDQFNQPEINRQVLVAAFSPTQQLVHLRKLESRIPFLEEEEEKDWNQFALQLQTLIGHYQSPLLGIGQESFKEQLREMLEDLQIAPKKFPAERKQIIISVFHRLKALSDQIGSERNGVRLEPLRSVRHYLETINAYQTIAVNLDELEPQYDKLVEDVSHVVWFFSNKEISSKTLASQEQEIFHQWFTNADTEWKAFEQNKSAHFKAPDQALNVVLEKRFKSEEPPPNYFSYFFSLLPVILIVLLLYFVFARQMKGMGGGAMSFGKSPARMLDRDKHKVTFKDVAGIDESLEELQEVVEFLKNPKKFTVLGGKIPKGVLCVGPPGTGKTLMAKAVAGEADRPFFSISGSDFVEMFVGVGASRIRDLFEQAKKHAPCIVFIDEIDAVGRHRGAGVGGGNDEREQTLNQLLVEMDGFDSKDGVILMAATNRPDVLDKALLRPGRFDRRVMIELPDVKGRYDILKVHARRIKLDTSVDLMLVGRSTPGCSGADLENLLNEAALLAARRERSSVTQIDIQDARDKVLYGKERRSLEMDENEKLSTSYHESGHAVIGMVVERGDTVEKVTIVPRGFSLGATFFLPKKNRLSYWKRELKDKLAGIMGGRVAEEIFVGDVGSGARQDIAQATAIARSMVCEWGMSEKLGLVEYAEKGESGIYLNGPATYNKHYSDHTAEVIDQEVRDIIDQAYQQAVSILQENKDKVELMTQMLMEFETLDREDIEKIMDGSWDIKEKQKRLKRSVRRKRKRKSKKVADPTVIEEESPIEELVNPSTNEDPA